MTIAEKNKPIQLGSAKVSAENWPIIVQNSSVPASIKTLMSMLIVEQTIKGDLVFRFKEDDAFMITPRFRNAVRDVVSRFLPPGREVHFSVCAPTSEPPKSQQPTEAVDAKAFRKKLGWLIKEAPDAVRMTITPEMAAVMLERNSSDEWRNRPESKPGLRRIVRAMSKGNWRYTGETIIFSVDGHLLNGQHRLHGGVESKTPFEALVAFGVDNDAFKYMDVGIARTPGHIFAIEGVPHYNFTASVCRVVKPYFENPKWTGSINNGRVENDELLEFFSEHPRIVDSYRIAIRMTKEGLLSPRWAGAMHYICACKSRAMADEFFEKLVTGIGITSEKDPVHVLRKRMISSSQSAADHKEASSYLSAYTIMAWNAVRTGRERSIYRWRSAQNPDERFPRAA